MASTYGSSVLFTKEKNVWTLSAQLQFGPNGAVTVIANNSKGFCAINQESVAFTGATTNSSTSLSSVSSFDGIFAGMTITGPAGELQANSVVSSFTAANKTVVLSSQAIVTDGAGSYNATGGRYRLQFGQQAATRLDPYVKLLGMNVTYDVSTGSSGGGVGVLQFAPLATTCFVIDNQITIRTIPATSTSGSTDASVAIQFGVGAGPGTGFQAVSPGNGEIVRVDFLLGNSTAP